MLIRKFKQADLEAVINIEKAVWGANSANADQILSRAQACPEGNLVAQLENGNILGYAAAQRINSLSGGTWADVTDNGKIAKTHDPDGAIAFGVGMSVLPQAARLGVSGEIILQYAKTFVEEGGCYLMALGSRLPGYAKWHDRQRGGIDDYLLQVRKDRSIDPELCLYEKAGFKLLWPVENYFSDAASMNWGAIIAMDRRTALEQCRQITA